MEKETIFNILSYAIHSPSTHNSQPWLFKIKTNSLDLFFDEKLKIPNADPEGRDLFISLGCLIENIRISASHFGYFMEENILVDKQNNKVANLSFTKNNSLNKKDEILFNHILKRVNARGIFNKEKIGKEIYLKIKNVESEFEDDGVFVTILDNKNKIEKIASLTEQAMVKAYNNYSFRKEMSHWMNSNLSNKKQGIPGYSLKMPLLL